MRPWWCEHVDDIGADLAEDRIYVGARPPGAVVVSCDLREGGRQVTYRFQLDELRRMQEGEVLLSDRAAADRDRTQRTIEPAFSARHTGTIPADHRASTVDRNSSYRRAMLGQENRTAARSTNATAAVRPASALDPRPG